MKITNYQFVDLGIDNPQYFPGFSAVFTGFEHSAVGTGSTEAEAFDDLMEQVAQMDFDTEEVEKEIRKDGAFDEEPLDDPERGVYFGLRWNA